MNDHVVIVGLGQLGRIFAGGFLRAGMTVVPVNRQQSMVQTAARVPSPALVLIAVAEADLHGVLASLPPAWKASIGLIQNELLPRDWEIHGVATPTVLPVWFEKKKGMDAKPLLPTPVFGPAAELVKRAMQSIDIPCRVLSAYEELAYELVRKNVYILTTNIAGMRAGGNAGQLWETHRDLAQAVASDVLDIQDWLTGMQNDRHKLTHGLVEAIEADPEHVCMGRSAPARLLRAIQHADAAGLKVPTLRAIQHSFGKQTAK